MKRRGPSILVHSARVAATLSDRPPWHVVSSRELASILGVSLQSLANWRVRDTGPPVAPAACFKGLGNRSFYRIDEVLEWLATAEQRPRPAWLFCRDYLSTIFDDLQLAPAEEVMATIEQMEAGGVFSPVWPPRSMAYLTAPTM